MAKLPIEAETRGAAKAVADLNKVLGKTEEELAAITKGGTKAERAARRFAEQADPTRKYERQLASVATAVKKGGLELSDAEKVAKKYGERLDRATMSGKKAFGAEAIGSVTRMVSGVASVSAAVGFLVEQWKAVEVAANRSASAAFDSLTAAGELQQISANPQQFQENIAYGRELIERGVFAPDQRSQAFQTSFSLGSAGFSLEDKRALAKLAERKQIAPEDLVRFGGAIRKVQNLFGGPEAISVSEAADKTLVAAGSTQQSAVETATATTQFSAASNTLEFDGNKTLAGLVLIEKEAKNLDEASTQLGNLLDVIDKEGLSTGAFAGTIDAIQARIEAGEGAFDILGNKRAVKGFRAIADRRAQLDGQSEAIINADGALEARQFIANDPILAASALLESTRGKAAAATSEKADQKELLGDVLREEITRRANSGDQGFIQTAYDRAVVFLADQLELERTLFRNALNDPDLPVAIGAELSEYLNRVSAEETGQSYTPGRFRAEYMRRYGGQEGQEHFEMMRRQAEAAERTADALESSSGARE